jgi:hypothetical protein
MACSWQNADVLPKSIELGRGLSGDNRVILCRRMGDPRQVTDPENLPRRSSEVTTNPKARDVGV